MPHHSISFDKEDNPLYRNIDKHHFISFIQKINSNESIPDYSSSQLNGKGYSFNPLPHERYDDHQDDMLYKNKAYDSTR